MANDIPPHKGRPSTGLLKRGRISGGRSRSTPRGKTLEEARAFAREQQEIEDRRNRNLARFESTRIERREDLERSKPKVKVETKVPKADNGKAYYGEGGPILDLIIKKEIKEGYKGPVIRDLEGKVIHDKQSAAIEVLNKYMPDIAKLLKQGKTVEVLQWIMDKVFPNQDLEYANLDRRDLKRADLRGRNLNKANLYRANLNGANLEGAKLFRAQLDGAKLKGANLKGADLREAFLDEADLRGANLEGADLRGALIRKAQLNKADFKNAKLQGANISGSNIEDAKTDETELDKKQSIRLAILGKDKSQLKKLAEKHGLRFHDLYQDELWGEIYPHSKLHKLPENVQGLFGSQNPNGFSV